MTRSRNVADLIATAVESADASIVEVVALTQAQYDALTPVATALYVVTD